MKKYKKIVKQFVAKKQPEQQTKYHLHALIEAKSAGRKAFLLMVPIESNPYSGDLRGAWSDGHRAEAQSFDPVTKRARYPYPSDRLAFGDRKPEKTFVRRFSGGKEERSRGGSCPYSAQA
jgi:hypothetical protein